MKFFKKGNGTMIFGSVIAITAALFMIYFINLASIRHYKQLTQLAADSMSDSLAIHMQTGGQEYKDAVDESKHLKKLIEQSIGLKITKISIDKTAFDDDSSIDITLETKSKLPTSLKSLTKKSYKLTAHSVTLFEVGGLRNAPSVIKWAMGNIGKTTYSMPNRAAGLRPDGFIKSTDCSGFVWWCYKKMGLNDGIPMWATGNMGEYFDRISPSEAKPGDALYITASERGSSFGHARLYIGNGMTLECTNAVNGVRTKPINLSNLEGYHFGRIKPGLMKSGR